jgi:hypothetical protein
VVRRRGTSSRYLPRHSGAGHPGTRVPPNTRREHGKKWLAKEAVVVVDGRDDGGCEPPPPNAPTQQSEPLSSQSGRDCSCQDCTPGRAPEDLQDQVPTPTSEIGAGRDRHGEGFLAAVENHSTGIYHRLAAARRTGRAAIPRTCRTLVPSLFAFVITPFLVAVSNALLLTQGRS